MTSDQFDLIIQSFEAFHQDLIVIRHLMSMILGFLFAWLWFHDF